MSAFIARARLCGSVMRSCLSPLKNRCKACILIPRKRRSIAPEFTKFALPYFFFISWPPRLHFKIVSLLQVLVLELCTLWVGCTFPFVVVIITAIIRSTHTHTHTMTAVQEVHQPSPSSGPHPNRAYRLKLRIVISFQFGWSAEARSSLCFGRLRQWILQTDTHISFGLLP